MKKALAGFTAFLLLLLPLATGAAPATGVSGQTDSIGKAIEAEGDYAAYLAGYEGAPRPEEPQESDLSRQEVPLTGYEGYRGLLLEESGTVRVKVTAAQAGLYAVRLGYVACRGAASEVEFSLRLNGALPFDAADKLAATKVYIDDEEIRQDNRGNDIRPGQSEAVREQFRYISDYMGYEMKPYLFYFEAGETVLEFASARGAMLLTGVSLTQPEQVSSYEDYLAGHPGEDTTGLRIKIDAETPAAKSAPTLYASCDRTSASIDPPPQGKIKLNIFGGVGFNKAGQWVEYTVPVETTGYYYLDLKYKQNMANGTTSYRRILVDGEVLFDEMDCMAFEYGGSWQGKTVGGADKKRIYLEAGERTIRIEAVMGDYGRIIARIEEAVQALNDAYRQSIMYLTATPDTYRDYDVEGNLPGVLEIFGEQQGELQEISAAILALTGQKNDKTALVDRFAYQLRDILKHPEELPKRLAQFRSNISALASLITTLGQQPLALDYLLLYSPDVTPSKADAGFFPNMWNELCNFMYTFLNDYNSVGNVYEGDNQITAWITSGRDQANVLKRMIDDSFSAEQGVGVNLKLVQAGMVLPAVVAGIGPDVVLQISNGDPVNYAIRGAVTDLTAFPDWQEVSERFTDSSLVPLSFDGALYGLPETENFVMMFYRKDILASLELEVPKTWEEAVTVITELQKNNLLFGLPQGVGANAVTYGMLLNQYGGDFYRDDTYYSALDSENSIRAFTFMTELFTNYQLPLTYDLLTRFRVGEMPLAIADYGFYNNLQVGAPEIRNLWDFTMVPGSVREDGSVDHSVINGGLACMMLKSTEKPEESWKFMKWWTSREAQARYGREMEMVLGPSGRVLTANLEAMEELPWSVKNIEQINGQRQWVKALESVPGGYFTSRHIDNAFRKVVISGEEPRETIREYVKVIDKEIETKCRELKIDVIRRIPKQTEGR